MPYPVPRYKPTSPIERLAENLGAGLHTLVLLDVKADEGRFMTAPEALRLMVEMADASGAKARDPLAPKDAGKSFGPKTLAVVVERAGEPDARARAATVERLLTFEYGPPMHCIIVPGAMHFEEQSALAALCGALPEELPEL